MTRASGAAGWTCVTTLPRAAVAPLAIVARVTRTSGSVAPRSSTLTRRRRSPVCPGLSAPRDQVTVRAAGGVDDGGARRQRHGQLRVQQGSTAGVAETGDVLEMVTDLHRIGRLREPQRQRWRLDDGEARLSDCLGAPGGVVRSCGGGD